MLIKIWNQILIYMDNSIFFRCINGIFNFFAAFFSKSIVVTSLSKEYDRDRFEKSFFPRLIHGAFGIFETIGEKFFFRAWENSSIVRFFKFLPGHILNLRIYSIGILILSAAVASCYRDFSIIKIIVAVLGVILFLFRQTLAEVLSGSALLSAVLRLVRVNPDVFFAKLIDASSARIRFEPLVCSIFGVLLGLVLCTVPYPYNIAAPFAVVGAALVVAYPYIGILGIVMASPFLPTMVLATGLGFVFLCFILKLATDSKYRATIDYCGFFVIQFILINVFAAINSFARVSSIKIALLITLFMASYVLVINLVNTRLKLEAMFHGFSFSAMCTGLVGFYQKISGNVDKTWVDSSLFQDIPFRAYSTFQNPNVYGEYLLLAIPICIAMIFISKKLIVKLYYTAVSALLIVNLGLTYSRGCYIALLISAVIVVFFLEKRLIAFFSIGIFALPFVLPSTVINRVLSITNFKDSSTDYRISIWKASIRMIRDFWYFGVGQGIEAYNSVYPLYGFNSVSAPHSHNVYLQVLVETGIVGFVFFIAIIFAFFKTQIPFILSRKDNVADKIIPLAAVAAVIGFMIQGVFDYVFYNNRVFLIFFICLGMFNAYIALKNNEAEVADKKIWGKVIQT